jgi:nitric oxide reductase subunit B
MEQNKLNFGRHFLKLAFYILLIGLIAGVMSAITYVVPNFVKDALGLVKLRPLHVSSVMFWIILGATGCVYISLSFIAKKPAFNVITKVQFILWIIALIGILSSYFKGDFGGREYWEFNPIWALPIFLSWILFLINFIHMANSIKKWPVYVWMWMTGIVFFLFVFIENYLWIFPYFREHFITDMTIQWKVNGSLVGSINQMLYGTAFFLMDKINKNDKNKVGFSKLAFGMYFLGLANLMFNWGHHIYTLPTDSYIRYIAYAVSMTEWVFFAKIIYNWRKSVVDVQKNYHYFPYRFLMAADFWVFVNMGQAILMSIPILNIYTHGTHVTVAHSMGTTIGINSMIIFSAAYMFLTPEPITEIKPGKLLTTVFWMIQIALFTLFISLDIAGITKGIWQMTPNHSSFSEMMESLKPMFIVFVISGAVLLIGLFLFVGTLLTFMKINKNLKE